MGWNTEEVRITVSLSNHNSDQDITDEEAWDQFKQQLNELVNFYEFHGLRIMVV